MIILRLDPEVKYKGMIYSAGNQLSTRPICKLGTKLHRGATCLLQNFQELHKKYGVLNSFEM